MKKYYELINKRLLWITYCPFCFAVGFGFGPMYDDKKVKRQSFSIMIISFEIRFYFWRTK